MRVAIDATAIGSDQGGDDAMVRGLLVGLAHAAAPSDTFPLIVRQGAALPHDVDGNPQFPVSPVRHRGGIAHFTVELPRVLRRLTRSSEPPELVCAVNHAPVRSPVPVALFVQDLSFHHHPEHYPPLVRGRLRAVVPRQARRAGAVLTISDFSRRDLIATYGLDPARVLVVPDAIETPPQWTERDRGAGRSWLEGVGVRGRFVLCLGNLHPRKNVARLIAAFGQMRAERPDLADVQLVVAGARWWGGGEEQAALEHTPPGSVVFLGPVDAATKEQLLHLADALAYVSLFEGFGLPPLEAMARGTPVVASGTTAVAETAGDGAVLVDPLDVGGIATALADVLSDEHLRRQLMGRGVARAAHYTTAATGRAAHDAFARILDVTARQHPPVGAGR